MMNHISGSRRTQHSVKMWTLINEMDIIFVSSSSNGVTRFLGYHARDTTHE